MNKPIRSFKTRSRLLQLGLALVVSSVVNAYAQSPLRQGGWEIQTVLLKAEPPGSSEVVSASNTERVCMTPEFIATNPYLNPHKTSAGKTKLDCEITDHVHDAKSGSWGMLCAAAGGRTTRGNVRVQASASNLSAETFFDVLEGPEVLGTVRVRVTGRYIGPCTAKMPHLK